jgi:hypothetical protein
MEELFCIFLLGVVGCLLSTGLFDLFLKFLVLNG